MLIPSEARKKGKIILLLDNLFIVLGFYVVFPLVSIHFIGNIGWSAAFVGLALGCRQIFQQGLGILGGALANKVGAKPMIVIGMLLRSLGFVSMALAYQPWILILSCILSALGGLLFDPPRMALAIKFTKPAERGRFISLLMIEDNAGAVTGALIGGWLIQYDFQIVCWVGATIFMLCAIFNMIFLPSYHIAVRSTPITSDIKNVLRNTQFSAYVITLTGYYILWLQIMLMLPLTIIAISGEPSYVKWMYAIQAVISLCLLYPIARWSEKRFSLESRLIFGLGLMTIGFFTIAFITQISFLFICIAIYYLGAITSEPARETLCTILADPKAKGSYMGFSKIGLAMGGFIGYTGAGWLYDISISYNLPKLPWLVLSCIGLLTIISLYLLFKHYPYQKKPIFNKKN